MARQTPKEPLKMILPTDYYQYDDSSKLWVNISGNQALLNSVINKGIDLKISGIVKSYPLKNKSSFIFNNVPKSKIPFNF